MRIGEASKIESELRQWCDVETRTHKIQVRMSSPASARCLRGTFGGRLETTRPCKDCHAERSRGISGFFLRHTNKIAPSIHVRHSPLNAQCSDKKIAGGGARTHTILRSLDFESSASANSATPALGDRSERIRDSRASSTSWRCRVPLSSAHPVCTEKTQSAEDSEYYSRSSIRKPRGGPRISRRTIASRKRDVDARNVVMSVLRSSALAIVGVTPASVSAGALKIGGGAIGNDLS